MALKRLPNDVQSLLCASSQVNSYKRVVEELIYNSLDAESSSIAIRVHIQESSIQVIDNGKGIGKQDFTAIGHNHMTSKVTDVETLKAAPKSYGYRGEFLANIITVSQLVKITSRHERTEETWAKTFWNGKKKKFAQMTTRPTKGTTVDIKGFLYNLSIQKRTIDPLNDLQNIKLFLEQLSLIHNHISISLRDDSQNEILFLIHKKRDIYQTLSSLFQIDKSDVQELQVEKQEYKVKGFIGKADKKIDLHWIYLNGKFIHCSSKLHKIVNDNFKKYLLSKDKRGLKSKKFNDELQLFGRTIPFYFIFVNCPYIDYDVGNISKQSTIEFKNWEQINKLLEKLVKFYIGDVNLKEIKKNESKTFTKEQVNINTNPGIRDQIRKIMDKILGSNSKKIGVSQLQNGVKGKMVKRKIKKKTKRSPMISKLFLQNDSSKNIENNGLLKNKAKTIPDEHCETNVQEIIVDSDKKKKHKPLKIPKHLKRTNNKITNLKNNYCKEKSHNKRKELEVEIKSPIHKSCKTTTRQILRENKQTKIKQHNSKVKHLEETDSVYIKSKVVAQKAEEFLQHQTMIRKQNINYLKKSNVLNKNRYHENNQKVPPETNEYFIRKYIMNKLKSKQYKTTYDLVQTVLKSQEKVFNSVESTISDKIYKKVHRRNETLNKPNALNRYKWTNNYISSSYANFGNKKEISQYTTSIQSIYPEQYNKQEQNLNLDGKKEIYHVMSNNLSDRFEYINADRYSPDHHIYHRHKKPSHHSGPLTTLTYDSHRHNTIEGFDRDIDEYSNPIPKRQNIRFITKQSRDNFVISNDFRPRLKKFCNKKTKVYDVCMRQTVNESFYTIEFSKSNTTMAPIDELDDNMQIVERESYFTNQNNVVYEDVLLSNELNPMFGSTYTINPPNCLYDSNIEISHQSNNLLNLKNHNLFQTYSIHDSQIETRNVGNRYNITKDSSNLAYNSKELNIVFVSKSQQSEKYSSPNNNTMEPLDVCETVFDEIGSGEGDFNYTFNENNQFNDSLCNNFENFAGYNNDRVINEVFNTKRGNEDDVSHHFRSKTPPVLDRNIGSEQHNDCIAETQKDEPNKPITTEDQPNLNSIVNFNPKEPDCNFEINCFYFKNRPRFLPKGMSQIFENCHTKTACDYNLDKDYFEDSIYKDFVNDVQINTEIFEPIVQNVEDFSTKNIHKFQNKVKKDNASLVFDETSLKEAKVLKQVDCKFIAAIMKKRCCQSNDSTEYLILFDQHAVHERIRLEKNLADYIKEERWTGIAVDNIILKMSKDEILYLHNYKDKFSQLGLQWTILNDNEVTVHSIPEAILGKNPREVEKVIKAVRNLIREEIKVIKLQKCVSLYPKSIMDLVFSEACRYAIKFGDPLSKDDCIELINTLSNCKTPFQCAHGRPVMAVIMDIKSDNRKYKISMEKLCRFKQNKNT